ncbi:uncharacterized protein KIAA1257 homolog isoform X9 [Gallus gallus]|uniref:uncharacterized protein KIAA1257 homolog isoform X9 n=1 Tax=Gallus gallus TaxID=9031 RepID=UPI001AEA16E8|nr:uncharacterized protein KIAA1257 homolog isoform X9 [Gallus gallus]
MLGLCSENNGQLQRREIEERRAGKNWTLKGLFKADQTTVWTCTWPKGLVRQTGRQSVYLEQPCVHNTVRERRRTYLECPYLSCRRGDTVAVRTRCKESISTETHSIPPAVPLISRIPGGSGSVTSEQKQMTTNPPDRRGKGAPADELKTKRCYCIECFLLPDDLVPRKMDLVVVGMVAKLFAESDSKTIMPWLENDQMWISWSHNTNVNVTNEFLVKLRDHKITLKLWDTKDQVFSEARLTKPDVSSIEDEEAVEETDQSGLGTSSCNVLHPPKTDDSTVRFEGNAQLLKQKAVAAPSHNAASEETGETASNVGIPMCQTDKTATFNGRRDSGAKKGMDTTRANIASLQLDLMPLLSGENSVISRLEENSPILLDAYVSFTVETPLLSERQIRELNPLVIKICSATSLPNTPVPIEVLQKLCVPTYCKYKFHNFPAHQTHGQIHGTHVYFKDVNVFLTGRMKPGELQRCLRGPPLEIEVHDRDRKIEDNKKEPCLFGEDHTDENLGELRPLPCQSAICNSFAEDEVWHPHGVAKVSLSDLLLGKKYLTVSAPIRSCSTPNTAAFNKKNKRKKIGKKHPQILLPMGHYLQSDSLLKLRVEIAVPLRMHAEIDDAQVTDCPYSCIVYIFDYSNSFLLHDLVEEITEINAKALQLDCYPPHLIRTSLATLKLKSTLEKVSELDVVTGFHLLDGATHLFVLEGLKDKAIKRLWDRHFERTYRHEDGQLEILYNSQLSFSQRLYTNLEAIFYRFHLCKPLFTILKQPLLYVRGAVPWACFQALSRLSYLCHSKRLRDVIQGDLLPSAEMITALSREYGVPLADEDLFTQKPPLLLFSSDYTPPGNVSREKKARYSSLDHYNERYVLWKKEIADKKSFERNHIRANIDAVRQLKGKMKRLKFETFRIFPADGKSVYNYSSQRLNSAELAKKHLRQEMAKDPKTRFSYCHEYLSATFDPVDVVAACKESFAKSKSMWLSPDGFVFAGFKSSIESNLHPRMPDEARVEELREKWQENALFANMAPVLPRGRWSWDKRHVDFELYKKPPELPMATAALTDASHFVQNACDDTKLKVHWCSAAAELCAREPGATSELQQLQGLLKDEPLKFPLRKPGLILKPNPALSVLDSQNSSDVLPGKKSVCSGFVPGLQDHHSRKWNKNIIPWHNREHKKIEKLEGADFNLLGSKQSVYKSDQAASKHATTYAQQEDPLQNDILDTATASQRWDDPLTGH